MSQTLRIDAEQLRALRLHEGDVLRVLREDDAGATVSIERSGPRSPTSGKASQWIRSARGSVRLDPGESVDDLLGMRYAQKLSVK